MSRAGEGLGCSCIVVALVTGDKRDLLGLRLYEGIRIVAVREFLEMNKRLP